MHPLLFFSKPHPVRLPSDTRLTIDRGFIVNRVWKLKPERHKATPQDGIIWQGSFLPYQNPGN